MRKSRKSRFCEGRAEAVRLDESKADYVPPSGAHSKHRSVSTLAVTQRRRRHTPCKTLVGSSGETILVADKADFETKSVTRNK